MPPLDLKLNSRRFIANLSAAKIALALFAATLGCGHAPSLIPNSPPAIEAPAANLPVALRPYNWLSPGGSGSCVNASTVYQFRWRNHEAVADWWRSNHSGGETDSSIRRNLDAIGVKYAYTRNAEAAFLDWCSRTRRGAIIWFYDQHCVEFCGFTSEAGRVYANINDNNRPGRFIKIERAEFLQRWRGYGGFALSLLDPPVPPPLWPRFQEQAG